MQETLDEESGRKGDGESGCDEEDAANAEPQLWGLAVDEERAKIYVSDFRRSVGRRGRPRGRERGARRDVQG